MDHFIEEVDKLRKKFGRATLVIVLLSIASVYLSACNQTSAGVRIEGRLPFDGDLVITQ
jgi:hypothetical protein